MSHFSNRRDMCSSGSKDDRWRCPGRRPGGVATCRTRLKGWLRNVAGRSPIWGDVDLRAFCRITGYSREHATRELTLIRREDTGLVFETKLRDKKPNGRRTWGVIVADRAKLKYDKCSLFYDAQGCRLHNYTTLSAGGKKLQPTIVLCRSYPRGRGRPRNHPPSLSHEIVDRREDKSKLVESANSPEFAGVSANSGSHENAGGCDIAYIEKDSFGIQQSDSNGASRDFTRCRGPGPELRGQPRSAPLRSKAFSLLRRLEVCHWDNCKVIFARRTAFRYAYRALNDGHEVKRILNCYSDALYVCHGFAVDQACSTGRVIFFAPSSTVLKASKLLAKDGLSRQQRVAQWYQRNRNVEPASCEKNFDHNELARIRRQVAASFPRG